jgi:RNA polymerase sigma-70 factor (ECF subfamily)
VQDTGTHASPSLASLLPLRSYQVHDDEEALVRLAQQYDPTAFGQLYERYVAKIYSYIAFRVGAGPEAEDLTAEVFLKAMQSLDSYRWQGVPFSAWLLRIAHNWLVDYLRRKKRRGEVPLEDYHRPPDRELALLLEQVVVRQEIQAALVQLTEAQQQVVALRFAARCSIKEAAKIMGKTEGAVKSLQHNALFSLREILADYRKRSAQDEGSHESNSGRDPE